MVETAAALDLDVDTTALNAETAVEVALGVELGAVVLRREEATEVDARAEDPGATEAVPVEGERAEEEAGLAAAVVEASGISSS